MNQPDINKAVAQGLSDMLTVFGSANVNVQGRQISTVARVVEFVGNITKGLTDGTLVITQVAQPAASVEENNSNE